MREGRLAVRRYNSYHIVLKAEKVELPMVSPTFSVLFLSSQTSSCDEETNVLFKWYSLEAQLSVTCFYIDCVSKRRIPSKE